MTVLTADNSWKHGGEGVAGKGGNREDLSDIIYDVSPTDTPFITMAGSAGSASGVHHEWLTDELAAPTNNYVPEGHVAEPKKSKARVRIGNYTQILEKTASVTGTQEKVDKAGVKSEMAYQVARRMKEIKMDLELILVGQFTAGSGLTALPQIAAPGSESDPRKMASFATFMNSESYFGASAGVTAPTGDGKTLPVPGAARPFSEDILTKALEQMWINGSTENLNALMGSKIRGQFSKFKESNTRYQGDSNTLNVSIDVYDGDFHTVTATPDRYSDKNSVFLIDPANVGIADLRPIFSKDLAVTGDGMAKQIIWETTLKVNNPLAHGVIGGLTA